MTSSANRHRDAVQDGHVLLMIVQPFQPVGQFMLRQVHLEGLLILVLFQLFGGKGGKAELGGQVSVGLSDKDEPVREALRMLRRSSPQMVERGCEGEAGRSQGSSLQKFSSVDQHALFLGVAFAVNKRVRC